MVDLLDWIVCMLVAMVSVGRIRSAMFPANAVRLSRSGWLVINVDQVGVSMVLDLYVSVLCNSVSCSS